MCWTGSGPEFTLSWGGRPWTLGLDQSNPGLLGKSGRARIKLLSLEGLAKAGRFEPDTFTPSTLTSFERYRESVRATFAPPAWGGLVVRASSAHALDRDQVDLEVQMSAASVGELTGVEVVIKSSFAGQGPIQAAWSIPCARSGSRRLGRSLRHAERLRASASRLDSPRNQNRRLLHRDGSSE